jgi:hypothetical protein
MMTRHMRIRKMGVYLCVSLILTSKSEMFCVERQPSDARVFCGRLVFMNGKMCTSWFVEWFTWFWTA